MPGLRSRSERQYSTDLAAWFERGWPMPRLHLQHILSMLDEAYEGPAWHGPCLRGSLRGLTCAQLTWRPARGRHNIWEIAVHAAYWKYAVRRRLLGEREHTFPEKGSNWFERPAVKDNRMSARAWERDVALLGRMHAELRAAVCLLADSELDHPSRGSRQTPRRQISGIALHDVYHAGQIQLIRRLADGRALK